MKKLISFIFSSLIFSLPLIAQEGSNISEKNYQEVIANPEGQGIEIIVEVKKGSSFYYPLMAFWIEDEQGNFIQTLYVAESIAKGVFGYGKVSEGHWMPGEIRRPAALPYWGHRRGVKAEDSLYLPSPKHPVPDAYTGATPTDQFILRAKTDTVPPAVFNLYMEINQSWDWNNYWTNNKYPDSKAYKTSAQPAVVYNVQIDTEHLKPTYTMELIGHSHYAGKDGSLSKNTTTLSTALKIVDSVTVKVQEMD